MGPFEELTQTYQLKYFLSHFLYYCELISKLSRCVSDEKYG